MNKSLCDGGADMKSFFSRLIAVAMAFLMICSITLPQGAPLQVNASAAVSVLDITSPKKLIGNYTIERDEIIYIRDGGSFTVSEGVTLKVDGRLKIAEGGTLNVRGNIRITEDALASCSGRIKLFEGGSIDLDGYLWINNTGVASGKGVICVNNNFSDIVCKGTVTAKIKAPAPVERDGVTYVGGVLLVNKEYSLPADYGNGITPEAYTAYVRMKRASGYNMSIVSGFRSYQKQESTFSYWVSVDGYENAVTYSAMPGHSEHQTGLAMDITSLNQSYGDTAEGKWLAGHCHEYGFIIRYPKGKTGITGYIYEPWHIRYLGTSTAKLVHDSGLTLEEFLGVA